MKIATLEIMRQTSFEHVALETEITATRGKLQAYKRQRGREKEREREREEEFWGSGAKFYIVVSVISICKLHNLVATLLLLQQIFQLPLHCTTSEYKSVHIICIIKKRLPPRSLHIN